MKKLVIKFALVLLAQEMFAQIIQNVPYFYQYNNSINPGGSCQNTSIAMVLKFYGASSVYPDAISSYYGTSQAQTVSGLQYVFNSEAQYYGIPQRIKGHSNGTFAQIQNLLAAGKPVIVHGYFTGYGHVLVLVGYNGTHYIANDPAGKWSQQYGYGGYCQCNATEGRYVYYTKSAMENAIGPNGTIWYHEILNASTPTPTPTPAPSPVPSGSDVIKPYTHIQTSNPTQYKTSNFLVNFVDSDNTRGSGVDRGFYSVLEWNGTEWRANNKRGFFCDNFDHALHSDWAVGAGNWNISNNVLVQSNTVLVNTALSAPLNQGLSNRYIYHFMGKINGSKANHGAGVHIFCSNTSSANRGNNYLIFFRPQASRIQLMKVQNDNISILHEFQNVAFVNNKWYDYKIMYDRTTGKITVWRDDVLIGSFTDNQPISNGVGFSFRTRECNFSVNNLKVYRTRSNSVTVSVGANSNADVRYQSPGVNVNDYACKIKSLVVDKAGNISDIANLDLLIDWTAPVLNGQVRDGLGQDITFNSSTTQISANFDPATDTQSGISRYEYAIGTTSGSTNVVNWTSCGLNTSFTRSGLSLQNGRTYYVSVRALNKAGLYSSVITSNGQTIRTNSNAINNHIDIISKVEPSNNSNKTVLYRSFTICGGESIKIGKHFYSLPGSYTDTISAGGIDSIIHTQITVYPSFVREISKVILPGEEFTVGNKVYTEPGIYYDTLETINGCDSILISRIEYKLLSSSGLQTDTKLLIGPNPFENFIRVSAEEIITGIEIYNMLGQVIFKQQNMENNALIDLTGFPKGTYKVKAFLGNDRFVVNTLVKQVD